MKNETKTELIIDAIKSRNSIIKSMGYASAFGYATTILGLIASLGFYLFNKDLNGYAIWGMFGVTVVTIITTLLCSYMALDG